MTAAHSMIAIARRLRPFAICLAGGVLLCGCPNFKRDIGIEPTAPDEFAVEQRAPLTIPPDFDLRPPQPGANRPQEGNIAEKAKGVVDNAGPGKPGQQASGALKFQPQNNADPNAQVADQSLAAKLLQAADSGPSVVLEKRETTPLQGVY